MNFSCIFLPSFGFIFDFKSALRQNPSYKPVFVYLLLIPSLHYLAEIGLHVPGSLKEQFWTFSGSLKVLGSLKGAVQDQQQFSKGFSQDELESCQILS